MMKYNVKKIEITNTMTTTLTTSCKKRDTAISRFCRFLSEYDSCFKDSMLLCTMKVDFAGGYVDGNALYQVNVETDEYYMTYTECGDVYQVTIEFKHDENTTTYKSLANTSESNITNDNETVTDSADGNDNETQQIYKIKAYYDGKELTIPYNEYECKECAVEYIHNLFIERVIPYETLFILYYGKHVETITIEIALDIPDLLQCNTGYVNEGLKRDNYKIVREGLKRLCSLIDDSHKCIVSLVTANNTHDFVILNQDLKVFGLFILNTKSLCRPPESFARWLYRHTFTRKIILDYAEGDMK